VVDNVIATPLLQRPLELGADIVVYSATKHIDGQGRCLGGVILCDARFKAELLVPYLKNTGPALSPFNAWVLLKGLETLPLGLRAHVASTEAVARHLAAGTRASSRCSTPASTTTRSAPWRGGRWRPAGASCPSAPAAGGPGPSRWRTGSGW
jgi:cystathionine beta-lyase/cystathionine gamma-synthase